MSRRFGLGVAGLLVAAVLACGSKALAHDDDHDHGGGGYGGGRGGYASGGHGHNSQHGHGGHQHGNPGRWSIGFGGSQFGNSVQFGYVSPRGGFSIGLGNGGVQSGFGGYGGYPRSYGGGCQQQHRYGGFGPYSSFGSPPGGWGW